MFPVPAAIDPPRYCGYNPARSIIRGTPMGATAIETERTKYTPKRVLVMRPGALGDVLVTLPLLAAMRERFDGARVELMARADVGRLLAGWGTVDAACSIDRPEASALFMPEDAVPERARRFFSQFDLAVSLWKDDDGRIVDALRRFVPDVYAIEPLPDPECPDHISRQLLDRAAGTGLIETTPDAILPEIAVPREDIAAARRLVGEAASPLVAIHPGSGSTAKNWPAERFAEVARTLRERGASVIIVEGPADAGAAALLREALRGETLPELRCVELPVLAGALSLCDCLVGNDSGVSHLAAAVGTPVVAVFGPSDPRHWRPMRPPSLVVRSATGNTADVEVADVLAAVKLATASSCARGVS